MKRGSLIVITGPSGAGKGSILREVLRRMPEVTYSISATTRPKRGGEVEGRDYFFKSREEFQSLVQKGEMLEWAEFVGNYYGTPRRYVEERIMEGMDVILEIEIHGAKQVKEKMPSATFIFLSPPSLESLRERLRQRGTEKTEALEERVKRAEEEMNESDWFDYEVVNEDGELEKSIQKVIGIIERTRELM